QRVLGCDGDRTGVKLVFLFFSSGRGLLDWRGRGLGALWLGLCCGSRKSGRLWLLACRRRRRTRRRRGWLDGFRRWCFCMRRRSLRLTPMLRRGSLVRCLALQLAARSNLVCHLAGDVMTGAKRQILGDAG